MYPTRQKKVWVGNNDGSDESNQVVCANLFISDNNKERSCFPSSLKPVKFVTIFVKYGHDLVLCEVHVRGHQVDGKVIVYVYLGYSLKLHIWFPCHDANN